MKNTTKDSSVIIGSKLYYTNNGSYFGIVIKVLKQSVWVEHLDGTVTKRWNMSFAKRMVK